MNGHQKPHGRGNAQYRVMGTFLTLALVNVLYAAAPTPQPEGPLSTIEHALQLGNLRQSLPSDRRGIYLPPSVHFLARPPYLDLQDQLAGADIALMGGARITWTSAIDYTDGHITILSESTNTLGDRKSIAQPHGFRTGDKVEIFATGSAPRGLTTRQASTAKPVFYFVRTDGSTGFYLHKHETDAYAARQTLKPLPPSTLDGNQLGQLFFVPQALQRRRPAQDNPGEGEPPWEGILRRLKRVLESDATSRVKLEAKGVAMLSLALRAKNEGEHAVAHRFFDHYSRTNLYLPNPPASIPEVLLEQAHMHVEDEDFREALEKYYDAQKSLLARPTADERIWQWLNLQAKRGIADTFFTDTDGYNEDVRQWAFKMGGLEMKRTHSIITDTTKIIFENVVQTSRPHALRSGMRLHLLPLGTTPATVNIKADQPLYVKVVDDGRDDKFILLDTETDTRNPTILSGRLPTTPNTGKLFFLPYTAPASQLIQSIRPSRYSGDQLGLHVYPRLTKLYAAARLYVQLDLEVDDLKRVFKGLNNTLFAGPRGEDLEKWRRKWRRWSNPDEGKIDLKALAGDLPKLIMTPLQLDNKVDEEAIKERARLRQAAQPIVEKGSWSVIFDHMHNIFAKDSVPASGIQIDLQRDVLNKRLHGLQTGDPVRFSGPLPTTANVRDLDNASVMFVRATSLNQFSLHPSASEAVNGLNGVDFNGTGSNRFITLVGIPYEETTVGVALKNLAIAAELEGEFGRAMQYLTEYQARNPDSPVVPEALLRQGFLYRLMGQPNLAIEKFYETMTDATRLRSRNLLKYRRTTLMAQAQIADTYYADLRQYDEAIKFYQQLLNNAPTAPDEELSLENTKYKLIRCLVRRAMELELHATDPEKRRENPLLVDERHQRLTTLTQEATRFLVNHPRSGFLSQVRYLRATAFEQLGDEKNADKDYRTLIETPASEKSDENDQRNFWRTKAALDLADRMFARKRYADAVQVYPVLLPHNPTLDAHIRIQQQIAFCHGYLDNLEEEIAAWTRIDTLWRNQEIRLEEAQDILAVLEQQAKGLNDFELETQIERINKQKEVIKSNRTALTPRLELVAHMARARIQILSIHQRLLPQPVPAPSPAVANTP